MKIKNLKLNNNFIDLPIAHRGLHSESICENSLDSFRLAKIQNFAIEIDIHRMIDGEFVVVHDSGLKRVTGKEGIVENLKSTDLNNYKLWDGQKIPLLSEVLKLVDGSVPILIELKPENGFNKNDLPDLLSIIKKYNHPDKIAFQTFNPFIVRALKKLTNTYSVGILSSYNLNNIKGIKRYVAKSLMLVKYIHADFISYDIKFLPNKYVSNKSKKAKIPVLAWVVNSKEKAEIAKKYVNNIIFENVETLNYYEKNN